MEIKNVAILGANGTMGSNISAIFASFGNAKVYMVARDKEDAIRASSLAIESVKANSIESKLIPTSYEEIDVIIPKCDFIFESVAENYEVKKRIYERINPFLNERTIIASGTSGLSINKLSEYLDEKYRYNFVGVHMFNPPYNLNLCELIPSQSTGKETLYNLKEYLENELLRNVIVIKDRPAFLANRIGFQFINNLFIEAFNHRDKGGIDYIDSIFSGVTGRAMPPLFTSNFVGLDVHKAIVDNIYSNTSDELRKTFLLPEYIQSLIDNGNLGSKTGKGIYEITKDSSRTYDIERGIFRDTNKYHFEEIEKLKIHIKNGDYQGFIDSVIGNNSYEVKLIKRMMLRYIIYSLELSIELSEDIHSADHAMASGFGWIPPLSVIDLVGGKDMFLKYIPRNSLTDKQLELIDKVETSKYDFRSFLKAR